MVKPPVWTPRVLDLRALSRVVHLSIHIQEKKSKRKTILSSWPLPWLPSLRLFWDKEMLLQGWISGWFLRVVWDLVKELLQIESSWILYSHANLQQRPRALSTPEDACWAWLPGSRGDRPRSAWPRAQHLPWLGSAAQPSTEGPDCDPWGLWGGTILRMTHMVFGETLSGPLGPSSYGPNGDLIALLMRSVYRAGSILVRFLDAKRSWFR